MSSGIVTAVSRQPGQLDLFTVHDDGRVWTMWWNAVDGWSDWRSLGGFFPPGAQIAAVARSADNLDLFITGNDGRVYTSWWYNGAPDWSGVNDNWRSLGGYFPAGAPVTAVARSAGNLDLFITGNDGRVYTSWWYNGAPDWSGVNDTWRPLGGYFPAGAPVAAVARSANNLDLFITGNDGRVYTSWWFAGADWSGVNDSWRSLGGYFPAAAPVAAVARSADNLDLFITGNDGRVWTSWWYNGAPDWSGVNDSWRSLGGYFPAAAPIAAVARSAGNLDLFITGNDGRVYTSWWYLGVDWSGINDSWRSLGGFFPAGTHVAAVARTADNLDLFITGNDGGVYTSWWFAGADWSGINDNWALLDRSHQKAFPAQIASGGLAALGGSAEVVIFDDGSTRWHGHAHDSGADGYDFGVSALLGDRGGRVIAFAHNGHVGGTFTAGSRDNDWDEHSAAQAIIRAYFPGFRSGDFQFRTDYSSDIGSTLESAISFLTRWLVGSTPLGAAVGLVVFVGVEVGSLISTGSLVPGARVVEGVLWLAGPSNTLLALAAEGIASAGSRSRDLSQEEYDWANSQVFGGMLPPKDKIVLTDTIGAGNRAFTFPRFDNKITVNMGGDSFDDPRQYHVASGNKAYGEVFIHELTHAWQIDHTPMELALLGDALASKVCEAGGGNPYTYGDAGAPYGDFNLEQQAQIVSDWYSGRKGTAKDSNSPYFRYVAQNIRTGQY